MKQKIPVKCMTSQSKRITELEEFQGALKTLSSEAKTKLKESIKLRGFNTPIFVWDNKILDGHQRLIALKELFAEGYQLDTYNGDDIPIIKISAENAQEAATLVLQYNSQYGEITLEGLSGFVNTFNLNLENLKDSINLTVPSMESLMPSLPPPEVVEDDF